MIEAPAPRCGRDDRDRVHGADQVDVGGIDEARAQRLVAARADAGIGHDHIKMPERLQPFVEHFDQLLPEAHVTLAGNDLAARRLDLLDGLLEILERGVGVVHAGDGGTDVNGDDVGPLLRQPYRMAPALAARHPGDECDFPLELAHLSASPAHSPVRRAFTL